MLPIDVFWFIGVEYGIESKVDLVIDPFEEILLRRLWNQSVDVS